MRKFYLLLLVLINGCIGSMAQQKEGANWLFGGAISNSNLGVHLDFRGQNPVSGPFNFDNSSAGGAATISDKNGELLFFSIHGHVATRQIVNNKYQEMPNGSLFPVNNPGTFSELIIRSPVNNNLYYLFLITGVGTIPSVTHDLYVVQVDLTLNNGFGDVVPNSFQLLKRKVGPSMAALLHANNRDNWVLAQNAGGDTLQAFLLNSTGVKNAVISATNKKLDNSSRLKSSPNSNLIVASNSQVDPNTASQNVELFHFDRINGSVSSLYSLTLPNYYQKGFCFAFSPDNSKLYVGTQKRYGPTPGSINIYQFDVSSANLSQIQQTVVSIYNSATISTIIDMQLAINGKIYVTRNDTNLFLSAINCPDLTGPACNFQYNAVNLRQGVYGFILPALNQTIFRNAGILQAQAVRDTICLGDSVQLSAYGAGEERFRWQPANGLIAPSDTLANPFVKPKVTTTYAVTGFSQCATNNAIVTVTVLPKPTGISISGSASVCPQVQGVWYKAQNPQKQQISWGVKGGSMATVSNDSISVNWGNASSSASVWAVPKNKLGCPGDTTFFPVNINVILATETPTGPDTLCLAQAKNVSYRIGSTTGSVYTWGIQGGSIVSGQGTAIKVNWNQPGLGKLWVQEESQTSTSLCRGLSDTLRVLIQPSPEALTLTGPQQVFTLAENQEYRVLNPEVTSTFNWLVSGGTINSGQGSSRISVNWGEAGTGIVEVYEMNGFGCPGEKAALQVHVSGSPQPKFYNIITPNQDGLNDAFVIENLKWYPENELQIYNRWGTEVYRSSNYQNNWSAENVSSGVYYFYFRANGQSWKGWVEVVK